MQDLKTLHDQIRHLEKINLEKDRLILNLKSQIETKTKIISFYENPKYKNLVKTSLLFESVNHPISKF
tara:strand:- start:511 stop:714 length:204 start_codon:yes stop_codon:yes gene_type:complete